MTRTRFNALILQTLFQPREAAGVLIGMDLPRQWLWMALALMSVLNAIVYSLSLQMTASGDPTATALMPPAFHAPLLFAIFLFGALAITVLTLTWIGQRLGGRAEMDDILVLIGWLQVLRLILQVVVVVLVLVVPVLGAMVIFVGSLWGIYILVGFVDAAHRFDNMFKAVGVILLSLIAMAVALSIVLSVLGVAVVGGA
ncbi:Yip1 domain-containing protein [Roseovarius azorensis]|uniref:Yip1 domain-containing protein n=1 Tax=Roseovarius azorensis TaxID=1287727 RepID=A0A1H7W542_9RHOB|nr:YIP1 family protein [Roseovarius azorensis]SEM16444.1 Yip1 domain-containing protein [Roseovarius azorensis]